MKKTIFKKIIDREIPAQIIHETDELLAFRDINPQAPVHFLVIPKRHFNRIAEVPADHAALLGNLLLAAAEIARKENLAPDGYRIVINNGANGGETIPHLHLHVLGGRPLQWPPG
jgi:histidine triad (HIT) family protein